MYSEGFEQWVKLGKNFTNPANNLNSIGKATADICRCGAQEGIEMLNDNVSLLTDQMKRLSNIKKPEEFMNLTRECINEDMNAIMSNLRRIMELSTKTMEDLSHLTGQLRETQRSTERERGDKNR